MLKELSTQKTIETLTAAATQLRDKTNALLSSKEFAEFKDLSMQKLSTQSLKELVQLIGLNLRVGASNLIEYSKIISRYYSNAQFCKSDLSLILMYLFHNPYNISKRFLTLQGAENVDAYGETPLTTFGSILKEAQVTSKDHLFELGCGRGRCCFWANAVIGCKVTGIDMIPDFIDRANMIKNKLHLDGLTFRTEELSQADISGGTVYYLYGSALEDEVIDCLVKKLEKCPTGTKVITVSYPLSEYCEGDGFELMKRFAVRYPWGVADVYFQVKR